MSESRPSRSRARVRTLLATYETQEVNGNDGCCHGFLYVEGLEPLTKGQYYNEDPEYGNGAHIELGQFEICMK